MRIGKDSNDRRAWRGRGTPVSMWKETNWMSPPSSCTDGRMRESNSSLMNATTCPERAPHIPDRRE